MLYTKENLVPDIRKASDFNVAMKDAFSNFTSATNSEQEIIYVNPKQGVSAANSAQDIWNNFGGKRKSCKSQGLSGTELRICKLKLKAAGWKKGDPIPDNMMADSAPDTTAPDTSVNSPASKDVAPGMSNSKKAGIVIGSVVGLSLLVWGIHVIAKP